MHYQWSTAERQINAVEYDLERKLRRDTERKVHGVENSFLVDDMFYLLQFHYLFTFTVRHQLRVHCTLHIVDQVSISVPIYRFTG